MTVPLFESLVTFTSTLSRPRSLLSLFLDAFETPATNLVHFEDQLATAFAFFRCHWIAPEHSVTSLGDRCKWWVDRYGGCPQVDYLTGNGRLDVLLGVGIPTAT